MKGLRFHIMNLLKHDVDVDEADAALRDGWNQRRRVGNHYEVLGRTPEGRYLQMVVEVWDEYYWVFHTRAMTDSERRRYHRK